LPLEARSTTYVLAALRESTFVWVLVFPNSEMRVSGISSVNARSSSGVGLT
jgi:hypothetical protein